MEISSSMSNRLPLALLGLVVELAMIEEDKLFEDTDENEELNCDEEEKDED